MRDYSYRKPSAEFAGTAPALVVVWHNGEPVGMLNRTRDGYALRNLNGRKIGETFGVSRDTSAAALVREVNEPGTLDAELAAQQERDDDTCADCLANARTSAVENWRDANGHEPATAAELAEVEREARSYVAEGMTTPCEAHKPIDPRSLPYRNGNPVVGCVDCLAHAASSADENWCEHNGRAPETDAELAEIDAWAKSYVAEGMTTACTFHAEPPREVGVVVGTVACFDCDETHEASYSHEGSYGEGAVYAVVCGDFIEHYTAEAVDFGKRLKPTAGELGLTEREPVAEPVDRRRVHFLGTIFASRAACGRMIMSHRDDDERQPLHTADRAKVTCAACRKAMPAEPVAAEVEPATVTIAEVEPSTVEVEVAELVPGDVVFSVYGDESTLARVRVLKDKSATVYHVGGRREWLAAGPIRVRRA